MDPKDFDFTIKTGHESMSQTANMPHIDEHTLDIMSMSMVFFEESIKDAAKYCAMFSIAEIGAREIIMSLKAQLLRNDGKTFLDTEDLIKRSNEYRGVLLEDDLSGDESESEEEGGSTQKEKPVYTDEEKQQLKNRFEYANACWNHWHPDREQNGMAYLMKECIQRTIDKFA